MNLLSKKTRRQLRPKPPISIAPVLVSDETCFAVVGLTPRRFRELVDAHPQLPRIAHGRRLLVPASALLALAKPSEDAAVACDEPEVDDGPRTVEEVIAFARRRTA